MGLSFFKVQLVLHLTSKVLKDAQDNRRVVLIC